MSYMYWATTLPLSYIPSPLFLKKKIRAVLLVVFGLFYLLFGCCERHRDQDMVLVTKWVGPLLWRKAGMVLEK